MKIELFKRAFDTLFLSELDTLLSRTKKRIHNPHIHGLLDHVYEVAKNGKRIRPYVMTLAYGATTFEEASKIHNQLIGIELLHLFALIHDDIMDDALTRHGVESVNAFLENLYKDLESKKMQGKHEAILVGDLVYSFACNKFSLNATPDILELFYELIDEVILGQMIDIRIPLENSLDETMIRERMLLKTARYSFARPMQIGAQLSGKSTEYIQTLFTLGEELGIIYQITDDIIDVLGDTKVTKKVPLQDLYNGQETFLTYYMKTQKPSYYSKLQQYYKKTLSDAEVVEVITIFNESSSIDFARSQIGTHSEKASAYIEKINNKEQWDHLLQKILHRIS